MYKSEQNKFLVLKRDDGGNLVIVLDDFLDGILVSLDPVFEEKGVRATATSGIRTENEQMELIRQKALSGEIALPLDLGAEVAEDAGAAVEEEL